MRLTSVVLLFFLLYTAQSFCPAPTCVASKPRWILRTLTRELSSRLLPNNNNNNNATTGGLRGLPHSNALLNSFDVKARKRSWDESFQLLKNYSKVFQTTRVAHNDDSNLANWVSLQRQKKHSLSKEKVDQLSSIGFEWENGKERKERLWQESFDKLKMYEAKHGDFLVPYNYDADPPLGHWVKTQRTLKKKDRLPPEREKKLDQIGFVWRVRPPVERDSSHFDVLWEQQYNKTVAFRETHGHCMVPRNYAKDSQLAAWVRTQREVYRNGDMRPDRERKLNEIEFVWDCTLGKDETTLLDLHWDEMLKHLLDFKAEKGHTNVPRAYSNFGSGMWVHSQRQNRNNNSLTSSRKKMLTEIGFQWTAHVPWNERFEQVRSLFEEQGNSSLPLDMDSTLRNWIYKQRYSFRDGKRSSEQIEMLKSIDFPWSKAFVPRENQ